MADQNNGDQPGIVEEIREKLDDLSTNQASSVPVDGATSGEDGIGSGTESGGIEADTESGEVMQDVQSVIKAPIPVPPPSQTDQLNKSLLQSFGKFLDAGQLDSKFLEDDVEDEGWHSGAENTE